MAEPDIIYEFDEAVAFVAQWTGLDAGLVARVLEARGRYLELAGIAVGEEDDALVQERVLYAHLLPETPDFIDDRETEYLELVTGCDEGLLLRIGQADSAYQDTLALIEWKDDAERDEVLGAPALPEEEPPAFEEGHARHWPLVVPDLDRFLREHLTRDLRFQAPSPMPPWHTVTAFANAETPALETWHLLGDLPATSESIALFPMATDGAPHRLHLVAPLAWTSRCEAIMLAATPSGYPLAYFDTTFLHPGNSREPGDATVRLAAFAFGLAAVPDPLRIATEAQTVRALRACQEGTALADVTDLSPMQVDPRTAAFLLPRPGGNPDEYLFQGPVTAIDVTRAWGQILYRLEVTVMRVLEEGVKRPFTLPIYVARHTLKDGRVPRAGDPVRGALWLQGRRADLPLRPEGVA